MTNILQNIIAEKKMEVARRKQDVPVATLEQHGLFKKVPASLKSALTNPNKTAIIAEFKRASPSKGSINKAASVAHVVSAYAAYGAAGVSVLTDGPFFGGHLDDLAIAAAQPVPVLRKDFMIDAYQMVEAKAYGASVVLLIAACLSPASVKALAKNAKDLGLEVLLELHDETELDHICTDIDVVGINNRNLKTFVVDLEHSVRLAQKIDPSFLKIAESGISGPADMQFLKQQGFDGFLIGESFMKTTDPGTAFRAFVEQLNPIAP